MYRGHTAFSKYPAGTVISGFPQSELFRFATAPVNNTLAIAANSTRLGTGRGVRMNTTPALSADTLLRCYILPSIADGGDPIVGFPYRIRAVSNGGIDTPIVAVTDELGVNQVAIQVTAAGVLIVRKGSSTLAVSPRAPLLDGVWYYMEARYYSDQRVQLWVDGEAAFSAPVSFSLGAGRTITDFSWNTGEATAVNAIYGGAWDLEHAVLVDTFDNGDGVVDRLGDGRINYIGAIAEVGGQNTGYVRTGGASIQAALNTIDADTSYYGADTAADQVIFSSTDILPYTPTVIHAVQVEHISRRVDTGLRTMAALLRSGGDNYEGDAETVTSSYTLYRGVWTEEPDAAIPWTKTLVEAADFGVIIKT